MKSNFNYYLMFSAICASRMVKAQEETQEVEQIVETYSLVPVQGDTHAASFNTVASAEAHTDATAPQKASGGAGGVTSSGDASKVPADGCQCAFPQDQGLVAVTPNLSNAGWAMGPNMVCSCGTWCPYACPAGFQAAQWDTDSSAGRMHGGMFCNFQGQLENPRPDEPLCKDYRAEVSMKNVGLSTTHACQTVLPGSESMLIPNVLPPNEAVPIAIPDNSAYKAPGTSEKAGLHFYINPHGVPKDEACKWGIADDGPQGNWAPYVLGTNRDVHTGNVYVSLSWNPVYLEYESPHRNQKPNYGVRIDCTGGGCDNSNCAIDPSIHEINGMEGGAHQAGAEDPGKGPAQTFCVTKVPQGGSAEVIVFEV